QSFKRLSWSTMFDIFIFGVSFLFYGGLLHNYPFGELNSSDNINSFIICRSTKTE
ncbi:hypothetical protein L9F63_006066, partial [Diploptera punctata]